jgi:Tol biopolymer transport system component
MPTAPATAEGTIVGTLQYMAPEQLEGKDVDARADLFAFGTLLYEMVTGKPAFEGKSQASLIAAILERHPPAVSTLVPLSPPALDRLVSTCLAKDPDQRFQSSHDIAMNLKWIREGLADPASSAPLHRHRFREAAAWVIAVVAVLSLLIVASGQLRSPGPAAARPAPMTRLSIPLPDEATEIRFPVISSDGRQVAFVAEVGGSAAIWVRPFDSLRARLLGGTQGAEFPFWSSDSEFLAFFADGKLKKIALAGGAPQILCDALRGRGGSWNQDDVIIFTPDHGSPLHRVSANGGTSVPLTTLATSPPEQSHRLPHFLPDGRHFVFAAWGTSGERSIVLSSLDSPQIRRTVAASFGDAYVAGDHLLFTRDDGTLVAQPIDLEQAALAGEAFPLAHDLNESGYGSMSFSVAGAGLLVYATRSQVLSQLTWVDRHGRPLGTLGLPAEHLEYWSPSLSPDETRVALTMRFPESGFDVVVRDLTTHQATQLTSDPSVDDNAIWAPDGRRLVFSSQREGVAARQLFETFVPGGRERPLVPGGMAGNIVADDWSSDGQHLLLHRDLSQAGPMPSLWILPLTGDRTPRRWFEEKLRQHHSSFSPDNRWIAYALGDFGQGEIWIRSFSDPSIGRRIGNGEFARWRADGRELVYFDLSSRQLMAVDVRAGATSLEVGAPRKLFDVPKGRAYDVTRDGSRFLFLIEVERKLSPIHVVQNWQPGLRR